MKYLAFFIAFIFCVPVHLAAQTDTVTNLNDINQLKNINDSNFTNLSGVLWNIANNSVSGDRITADAQGYLESLDLYNCYLSGVLTIHNSEKLNSLDLYGNLLTGVNLKNLTSLRHLDLSNNNMESGGITVEGLDSLQKLELQHNNLTNIDFLKNLTSLQRLNLLSNQLEDISSLAFLEQLHTLILTHNNINDISSLSSLTELTDLQIHDNNIKDISSLSSLKKMEILLLSNNRIENIDALSEMTNLQLLAISGNNISDINPLSPLTNLYSLDISNNKISNISLLSNFKSLSELYLNNNEITDISALSGLGKLSYLYLADNRIDDISPLLSLNPYYVSVEANRLTLSQLKQLTEKATVVDMQNQSDVYFYKRLHLLNKMPSYEIPPEDAWIDGTASLGTLNNSGAIYQNAQAEGGSGYLLFDAAGEYVLSLSNENIQDYFGLATTSTGTFIVLDKDIAAFKSTEAATGANAVELAKSIGYIWGAAGNILLQQGFFEANSLEDLLFLESLISALNNNESLVSQSEKHFLVNILQQVPGEIHAGIADSLRRDLARVFSGRLRSLNMGHGISGPQASAGDNDSAWRFNSKIYKGSGHLGNHSSYFSSSINSHGSIFSLDRLYEPWRLGGAIAVDRLKQRWNQYSSKADIDSFATALYGSHYWKEFTVGAHVHTGYGNVKSERSIAVLNEFPKADYKLRWYGADIYAAYNLRYHDLSVRPSIGLSWLGTRQNAFNEKWHDISYLSIDKDSSDSLEAVFNLHFTRPFSLSSGYFISPYLDLGVAAEMAGRQTVLNSGWYNSPLAGNHFFQTKGPEADRLRWSAAAGVEAEVNENISFNGSYKSDFSGKYRFNQGEAAIRFSW